MKQILLFNIALLAIGSLLGTCSNKDLQRFMPGTYVRMSINEFGTEYDTIVIAPLNKLSSEYSILRKWRYERIFDGSPIEPEYKKTIHTGSYDAAHGILNESETGSYYSFDPKEKILFSGNVKYQKL